MELGEILTYAATALGGGGIASVLNWKWNKRKAAAETKLDEVEVVKKIIEDVYQPTIDRQKKELESLQEKVTLQDKEIADLRSMIKDCADSRDECHKMLATLKDEIARLQRSRDKRGRYAKEERNGDNIS